MDAIQRPGGDLTGRVYSRTAGIVGVVGLAVFSLMYLASCGSPPELAQYDSPLRRIEARIKALEAGPSLQPDCVEIQQLSVLMEQVRKQGAQGSGYGGDIGYGYGYGGCEGGSPYGYGGTPGYGCGYGGYGYSYGKSTEPSIADLHGRLEKIRARNGCASTAVAL